MAAKGAQSVIVDLDVGGTLFRTTKQTLLSDPNSMLAKMFDPSASLVPVLRTDGAYFIDRDPVYFRVVLNFLRTGYLDKIDDCDLPALLREASFFGIQQLESALQSQKEAGSEFLLNVGGQIFVTTKETLCREPRSLLAEIVKGGKHKQLFDKDGNLLIDQDPNDFAYILKRLRNTGRGRVHVPEDSKRNVSLVARDMRVQGFLSPTEASAVATDMSTTTAPPGYHLGNSWLALGDH